MENLEQFTEQPKKWYHKFEAWAKKHPYAAGASIAVLVGGLYYLLSKLGGSASTTQTATPTAGVKYASSGTSATPVNSSGYSAAELAAENAKVRQDLSNQVAAAREQIKSAALQSVGSSSASSQNAGLMQALSKIASGFFDKNIDSAIKNSGKTGLQNIGEFGGTILSNALPGGSGVGVDASVWQGIISSTGNIYVPDGTSSLNSQYNTTYQDIVYNNDQVANNNYIPTQFDTSPNYNFDPANQDDFSPGYVQDYTPEYTLPADFTFSWEAPQPDNSYPNYDSFMSDWSGGDYYDY